MFYLGVFVFFFKLIDRVFVMKWQSDNSSQTMSFTQDEISEVDTALSTLFGASVSCLPKVRWAPKCYLLFSLLLFFCAPWDSMSFLWKLMLSFTSVLLVSLSSPSRLFYFSFSFPLLFKLYLCNSLELHAEKTWLDCNLSRVTNEMNLGNLCLLMPSAKNFPKFCSFASQLLKPVRKAQNNKIMGSTERNTRE